LLKIGAMMPMRPRSTSLTTGGLKVELDKIGAQAQELAERMDRIGAIAEVVLFEAHFKCNYIHIRDVARAPRLYARHNEV
jgi:hypothetical protein